MSVFRLILGRGEDRQHFPLLPFVWPAVVKQTCWCYLDQTQAPDIYVFQLQKHCWKQPCCVQSRRQTTWTFSDPGWSVTHVPEQDLGYLMTSLSSINFLLKSCSSIGPGIWYDFETNTKSVKFSLYSFSTSNAFYPLIIWVAVQKIKQTITFILHMNFNPEKQKVEHCISYTPALIPAGRIMNI